MPTVSLVRTPADQRRCLDVRCEVFVRGQGVPLNLEVDGLDADATHLLATVAGEAAGTIRLREVDGVAKLERLAVRPTFQGRGIGRALVRAAEAQARLAGRSQAKLGAQVTVIPFYEALGYGAEGPIFLDAGIDHRMMYRQL